MRNRCEVRTSSVKAMERETNKGRKAKECQCFDKETHLLLTLLCMSRGDLYPFNNYSAECLLSALQCSIFTRIIFT